MEINVTTLATESEPFDFSSSVAERGPNAGPETWANAKAEAKARPILSTESELDEFRDYMREFGAWEDDEINNWDATECNALLVQLVAGDLREAETLCPGNGPANIDWDAYRKHSENGTCSGRVCISGNEEIFYYVGN